MLTRQDMARMKKAELVNYIWQAQANPGHHRRTLPDTRPSVTHKFKIDTAQGYSSCTLTVGFFEPEEGSAERQMRRPGEVFIRVGKQGSTLNGLLDVIGILISYGLQYGVPLGDLCGKLKGMTFEPAGPTSNPDLPECGSIIDYVFSWLEKEYGPFDRPSSTSKEITT